MHCKDTQNHASSQIEGLFFGRMLLVFDGGDIIYSQNYDITYLKSAYLILQFVYCVRIGLGISYHLLTLTEHDDSIPQYLHLTIIEVRPVE